MRALIDSWHVMSRQRRTGWTIIVISVAYILYFLKARLFAIGPEISRKEWFYVIVMLGGIILGTINVRMAEMRERNQKAMPLVGKEAAKK
jgi:uncharacterized membrane protein YkvI